MARRSRHFKPAKPERRSALGTQYNAATAKIDELEGRVIAASVKQPMSVDEFIRHAFSDDVRRLAQAANSVLQCQSGTYTNYPINSTTSFRVPDFDKLPLPMAAPALHKVNDLSVLPALRDYIAEIDVHRENFSVVKHVLRWMDEHCTLGCIRYYLPTAMTLAPGAPWNVDGGKFTDNPKVARMRPLIDAANMVLTAAQLAPAAGPRPTPVLEITFAMRQANFVLPNNDGERIDIEQDIYHWF